MILSETLADLVGVDPYLKSVLNGTAPEVSESWTAPREIVERMLFLFQYGNTDPESTRVDRDTDKAPVAYYTPTMLSRYCQWWCMCVSGLWVGR